jgi:ribokinase
MLHVSSFADDRQFKVLLELVERLNLSIKLSFAPGALYAARGLKALSPILARSHVLFINQNEIQELTGKDFRGGAEICIERGCRLVVVTLGKGVSYRNATATSYIRDAENECTVESDNGNVVSIDATGAGDAFAAGFIYGLLKGKGLKECGRLGDIVAKFCIAGMGARQGLPTTSELARRYRELYNGQL